MYINEAFEFTPHLGYRATELAIHKSEQKQNIIDSFLSAV